jgi:hypothetical protein
VIRSVDKPGTSSAWTRQCHRTETFSTPRLCRSASRNNVSLALMTRFNHSGHLGDLDEIIALKARELRPASHPNRVSSVSSLFGALRAGFSQSSQPKDREEAVSLGQEILELLPTLHPHLCSALDGLTSALLPRVEQSGQHEDLEEVMPLKRKTFELQPALHSGRSSSLANLANALTLRFRINAKAWKKQLLYQEVLELRPASHRRAGALESLASALMIQVECCGHARAWKRHFH